MLKRSISLLLCAVLTLSLCLFALPETALAVRSEVVYLGGTEITPGYWTYNNATHTLASATDASYNVRYERGSDTNILTLKGVTVNMPDPSTERTGLDPNAAALYSTVSLTIDLIGENELTGPSYNTQNSCGICSTRNLTIKGTGSLTATGGTDDSSAYPSTYAYGIYGEAGITISGGTINATAKTASAYSTGLYCLAGLLDISGGTITATANSASGNEALGIYSGSDFTISGGTLNATASSSTSSTDVRVYGIYARAKFDISAGTITATANSTSTNRTAKVLGINGYQLSISGGTLTATANSERGPLACGIISDISFTISGGTVEAKGKTIALDKAPTITTNALIPGTTTASITFDVEYPETYNPDKNSLYKYFKAVFPPVSIAGLPMTASATESSYFDVNNAYYKKCDVYTVDPGDWDFKLELVEGKYKLTTKANNSTMLHQVGGIKSNVDLILHLEGDRDNTTTISAPENEPAILVNGNLNITAANADAGLYLSADYKEALNVTGNLTLDGATLETTADANGVNPISALVVGRDLTVNAGSTISAYNNDLTESNIGNRGAKVSGNVVMNGSVMNITTQSGTGLEVGGDIRLNSGNITLNGSEKALNKRPIMDPTFSHIWAFSDTAQNDILNYVPQSYDTTQSYSYRDDHKYVRIVPTPSASILPVTVSGTVNTAIMATTATITLENQSFGGAFAYPDTADVSAWFKNMPSGLTASLKKDTSTTATITFSGTPTAASTAAMSVSIPNNVLYIPVDLTATNASAKWNIAPVPTVTSVAVDPASASIQKGGIQTFSATVTGTNSPAQTVTWSVSGNISSNTTISSSGVLTIAANETAATLTVTATSTVDTEKSGTAAVTVTTTPPTVTSVAVDPASVSIQKGGTQTFNATVAGTNSPAQTVTWTVEGGVSGTTIDEKGVLTIAANETAATLTVKATSTVDTKIFSTATVTVTTPAPDPAPSGSDGGSSDYTPASVTVYNDPVQPKATVWLAGSGLAANDQLVTKPNPQGAAFTVMRTVAGKNEVIATYDISLQSGKKSTGSAMSLTFDLGTTRAGQEFTLVHQKADGTFEYFYAVADSTGRLVFNGIHSLSPFMIVKGRLAQTAYTNLTDMPKTGDSAQPALVTGIVMLMAIASLAGVALRKRHD